MIYPHTFQILVCAKNDLLMQKLCGMRLGVDALIRLDLEVLMRLVVKAWRLYSMRPSGWRW